MVSPLTYLSKCIKYFIPLQAGRKEFFYDFSDFFQAAPQQTHRTEQKPEPRRRESGQKAGQRQHQGAEGGKVKAASPQQRQRQIEPHLAPLRRLGVDKQQRGGPQPEQQIGRRGQTRPGQTTAQGPQQVVADPQSGPQQHPAQQSEGLTAHRDRHGRNSRRNRPPGRSACS